MVSMSVVNQQAATAAAGARPWAQPVARLRSAADSASAACGHACHSVRNAIELVLSMGNGNGNGQAWATAGFGTRIPAYATTSKRSARHLGMRTT
jgi:hypothetical protein